MKSRYDNITVLRSIAIILVVLGHATAIFDGNWGGINQIDNYYLALFCKIIRTFHMPLFMSISGYLFYKSILNKHIDSVGFILKKIKRLIIPFLLIKYLWVMPVRYAIGYYSFDINASFFEKIKAYIFNFDVGHLWFLYVLFAIFCIQIVIGKYVYSRTRLEIALVLVNVFGYFALYNMPTPISYTIRYNLYFTIGVLIHKYITGFIDKYNKKYIFGCGIISIIFTGLIVFVEPITQYALLKRIIELIIGICDIIILHYFACVLTSNYSLKKNGIIEKISNYSMGIYLFHEPVLYMVLKNQTDVAPLLLMSEMVFIGILISVMMTILVRKLKIQCVIGE